MTKVRGFSIKDEYNEVQEILDALPHGENSKFICEAILHFHYTTKNPEWLFNEIKKQMTGEEAVERLNEVAQLPVHSLNGNTNNVDERQEYRQEEVVDSYVPPTTVQRQPPITPPQQNEYVPPVQSYSQEQEPIEQEPVVEQEERVEPTVQNNPPTTPPPMNAGPDLSGFGRRKVQPIGTQMLANDEDDEEVIEEVQEEPPTSQDVPPMNAGPDLSGFKRGGRRNKPSSSSFGSRME